MSDAPWTARRALSDGLRAAGLWYGAGTIALAWLATTIATPAEAGPLALALVVVTAGGLVFLLPVPRGLAGARVLVAIAVEGAGLLLAVGVLAHAAAPPQSTAAFPLSPVKTAMIAFAVNAGRRRAPLLAGVATVVVAEAVCVVTGRAVGTPWAFDLPEAATLALVALASSGFLIGGRRTEQPRRAARSAAGAEALSRTRSIARSRAAAIVHDTVLGDLAALAATPPGPLPDVTTARLARTLEVLAAPDWLDPVERASAPPVRGGLVLAAVEAAEAAGLSVQLDGELGDLARLSPAVERALAAAVEQCLANTRRHAGTDAAEVTVLGDRTGVTVMVADTGAGFDPDRVDPNRLGLATSVLGRIEEVGGSARVFARPGVGTTVLLAVPKEDA